MDHPCATVIPMNKATYTPSPSLSYMPTPDESAGVRVHDAPAVGPILGLMGSFITALAKHTELPRLETQQQLMLITLYTMGEVSQADLPKYVGCQRSAVSRNIARLGDGEKPLEVRGPGWVEAYADLSDRRNNFVRLTARGKEVLQKAAREVEPLFRSYAARTARTLVGE
jgi:DNA-binding MarR family transcriptional regulator